MNILLLLQLLMVRVATISIFVFLLKFQFLHGFFKDLHPDDQVLCSFRQLNKEITSAVFRSKVSNNLKVILFLAFVYNIDLLANVCMYSHNCMYMVPLCIR